VAHLARLGRGYERACNLWHRLPVVDQVRDDTDGEGSRAGARLGLGCAIGEYAWQRDYIRYPAPVFFLLELNPQHWRLHSATIWPRPLRNARKRSGVRARITWHELERPTGKLMMPIGLVFAAKKTSLFEFGTIRSDSVKPNKQKSFCFFFFRKRRILP
jgi:hypothetical protein